MSNSQPYAARVRQTVKAHCQQHNISAAHLATETRQTVGWVRQTLDGARPMTVDDAVRLLQAARVPLKYVFH